MKLYVNRTSFSFDDAEAIEATQALELTEEDYKPDKVRSGMGGCRGCGGRGGECVRQGRDGWRGVRERKGTEKGARGARVSGREQGLKGKATARAPPLTTALYRRTGLHRLSPPPFFPPGNCYMKR